MDIDWKPIYIKANICNYKELKEITEYLERQNDIFAVLVREHKHAELEMKNVIPSWYRNIIDITGVTTDPSFLIPLENMLTGFCNKYQLSDFELIGRLRNVIVNQEPYIERDDCKYLWSTVLSFFVFLCIKVTDPAKIDPTDFLLLCNHINTPKLANFIYMCLAVNVICPFLTLTCVKMLLSILKK